MAEWLRPGLWEVLTIKLRGINHQVAHLVSEKRPYSTSRWFQSRPRFYMAPASADIFKGGRMAEWLRPADCEILTFGCVGSITRPHILSSKKDHIVRRVGFNHVRDSIYMAPASADILKRAGWPSGYGPELPLPRTDLIYAG